MTAPVRHDPDRLLEAFFEPGPSHLTEAMAAAIHNDIHHTRQRRAPLRPEGTMNRFAISVAGVGVVAAVALAIALLTSSPRDVVAPRVSGTPNASPSALRSATPSVELLAPLGYQAPGMIAFTRADPTRGADGTWLVSPDGSGETRVVVNTERASGYEGCCAVFSPDGTRLALGYEDTSGAGGAGTWMETQVQRLDGSSGSLIPNCGACAMIEGINYVPRAWSPDGSLLALEVWSDADRTRNGMAIALVNDFGWAEPVGGNHTDVPIAFSPDGTRILFVRLTSGNHGTLMELTIPDLTDACCNYEKMRQIRGETREVGLSGMLTTVDAYFGAPASWSPDGRQIAFAATDPSSPSGSMGIWVVPADGGEPRAIAPQASIYTGAAWSPDGNWIAFDRVAGGGGHYDAFIVRPDGTGEVNLTESFAPGVCCARWSPDSSALLVAGTAGANQASYLFIVPIDGSPIAQVTTVPSSYWDFSWGPASR